MEERRNSGRIEARLHARWETPSGMQEGTIINCSVHGCFVQGEVEEPGDEPVKLTILLPNGSIHLSGTVAFHLPTLGFGLHFTPHSDEDRSMFDRWRVYIESEKAAAAHLLSRPTNVSTV